MRVLVGLVAISLLGACSPELTFVSYGQNASAGGRIAIVDGFVGPGLSANGTLDQPNATLTASGLERLEAAVDEVESGWPYECHGCDYIDVYRFREEGDTDLVRAETREGEPVGGLIVLHDLLEEIEMPMRTCRQTMLVVPLPNCRLL